MPSRTPKVTAVPVEEGLAKAWSEEQPTSRTDGAEAKTDAEEMTDVINEVKVTDEATAKPPPTPELMTEGTLEAKPKAKAKPRPSRAEPKVEDAKQDVVEVKPALGEAQAVTEVPKEEPQP